MNFIENLLSQRNAKITKNIRVLGIDLGTTNSTVAEVILKPNEPPTCKTIEIDQPTREMISDLISCAVRHTRDVWHTILEETKMTERDWSFQPLL